MNLNPCCAVVAVAAICVTPGVGFVDFLLDSSTFYSRITPAFRNKLGLGPADGVPVITGQKGPAQKTAAATVAEDSSTQGIAANSKSSDGNSNSSISSSNGTSSSSNSSSKNTSSNSSSGKLRMRQRVQLPDLWLGECSAAATTLWPVALVVRQRILLHIGHTS